LHDWNSITMPVHIGEARLVGDFTRYTKRFSFIELDTEPGHIPSKARLRACAAQAPDGFVFSLIVPTLVASLETNEQALEAYKRAEATARLLGSKWWVVRTPAQVRPTRRSREQLAELFARLRDGGQRIAWEPRGVWEDSAAAETAGELSVHLVHDVAQQAPPPEATLYSRILALGRGSRVGLGLAVAVAERLRGFDEAFVVVEGRGAQELQQAVAARAAEPDDANAPALAPPLRSPLVSSARSSDDDLELEVPGDLDERTADDDDLDDEDDDDDDELEESELDDGRDEDDLDESDDDLDDEDDEEDDEDDEGDVEPPRGKA
jgi:uncharacterized protein DUF72